MEGEEDGIRGRGEKMARQDNEKRESKARTRRRKEKKLSENKKRRGEEGRSLSLPSFSKI
jgi:hypothetical protein